MATASTPKSDTAIQSRMRQNLDMVGGGNDQNRGCILGKIPKECKVFGKLGNVTIGGGQIAVTSAAPGAVTLQEVYRYHAECDGGLAKWRSNGKVFQMCGQDIVVEPPPA